MNGGFIFLAEANKSPFVLIGFSLAGRVGILSFLAIFLASTLSSNLFNVEERGPINLILLISHSRANFQFSAKNP